jgi:HlyD family secretion protein
VAQAEATLEHMVIRAPFDGVVTVRHREPGESVAAGMPVVTVLDPSNRWVRIYVPAPALASLVVGALAWITVEGRPDEYEGRVVQIADEAEFTPRNVQTPEDRVNLVFAVRVAITGDEAGVLKPGLPADVRLETVGAGRGE